MGLVFGTAFFLVSKSVFPKLNELFPVALHDTCFDDELFQRQWQFWL
jgi:hypothetical protein